MGMTANYMEAGQDLLEELKKSSIDELFDKLEELEDEEVLRTYYMDKLWDGLHFVLTGVSAISAAYEEEKQLLSEAVVGTAMFVNDKDADYIAYIEPERVKEIYSALCETDMEGVLSDFSPRNLARNQIYPSIWREEDKEELKEELITTFEELKEFYCAMSEEDKGIVVSIY